MSNHIHRYRKVNLARNGNDPYIVYKCVKPTCSHYVPLDLAEGKLCECDRCGDPMTISKITLRGNGGKPMSKPHCLNCIQRKKEKAENVEAITEFLAGTKS
jgi:hypothetical protein